MRYLWIALLVLCACGHDSPVPPDDTPAPDPIRVPLVTIAGTGSRRIGTIDIRDGVGTCEVDGASVQALVYWTDIWSGTSIFHLVAPTADEMHVLYIYSRADTLRGVWHESYTQPLHFEQATGTVDGTGNVTMTTPPLACLEAVPDHDRLVTDVTIDGAELNWPHGSGTILIDGQVYKMYPFQFVDCSDCGETENDGWYELHTLFCSSDDEKEFGILYLRIDRPDFITLQYRFRLCDLHVGAPKTYKAYWSVARLADGATER